MICPKCGFDGCQVVTETTSKGKDFSAGKGCCGALLLGPIGILCGACGKGKKIKLELSRKVQSKNTQNEWTVGRNLKPNGA